MNYIEIEPTLAYFWGIGNKITTIYVDYVDNDPDYPCLRASIMLDTRNNGVRGWLPNASFNREEAVKELRKKIREEYDAAVKKAKRLEKQYSEAK
jgi:hypothetical protein